MSERNREKEREVVYLELFDSNLAGDGRKLHNVHALVIQVRGLKRDYPLKRGPYIFQNIYLYKYFFAVKNKKHPLSTKTN